MVICSPSGSLRVGMPRTIADELSERHDNKKILIGRSVKYDIIALNISMYCNYSPKYSYDIVQ